MMDYVVNINGVDIVIEQNEKRENRDRLLKYYNSLLGSRGIDSDEGKQKALESIVDNMTEAAAKEKLDSVDDSRLNRLMAYANAFAKLTKEEEDMADALAEVIDATAEDAEQDSVLVNGNKFLFEKDSLDIEKYMEKLYSIGEEQKGNTWTIYLDDEGELVIY